MVASSLADSATLRARLQHRFPLLVLLLACCGLPAALLPSGFSLAVAGVAWACFSLSLTVSSRRRADGLQLGAATALVGLAALEPPIWVGTSVLLLGVACLHLAATSTALRSHRISLGVGVIGPLVLYGGLFALGSDERNALKLAFHFDESPLQLVSDGLALVLLGALTVACVAQLDTGSRALARARWGHVALAPVLILLLRLVWIVSVASLRTDLLVWSEPPALLNLLKLSNGERFYGPMEWANSYSYSPGLELTQFALLRPAGLALSLYAHRALGIVWQLGSALVLTLALRPWLGAHLRPLSRIPLTLTLFAVLASVTLSSFLAPHVHPDHLLILCFSGAVFLCLRPQPFGRRDWLALGIIPVAATVFKLTGAGVGLGLVLAALPGRHFRALGVLLVAGLLAFATIPLFDSTLGEFSAYAIRLQASHPIEWGRVRQMPGSPPGLIFTVASCAVLLAWWLRWSAGSTRAAARVLLLTLGFGATSTIAYLKHGGRENSLLPFAIGGAVAILVLLSGEPGSHPSAKEGGPIAARGSALLALLCWLSLSCSWPKSPVTGASRATLIALHEREVSWLRTELAQGRRPLAAGAAAWIDVGRREVPRDCLGSATELDLGHFPALRSFERHLSDGSYDGLFVPAVVLLENDLLKRLRGSLERDYRVVEPAALGGAWPVAPDGYVILERRQRSHGATRTTK